MYSEIKKSKWNSFLVVAAMVLTLILASYIIGLTIAKINLFAGDVTFYILFGVCVYLLIRYHLTGFLYKLENGVFTITKCLGSRQQLLLSVDVPSIVRFCPANMDADGAGKQMNFCATLFKKDRYIIYMQYEGHPYRILFQPSPNLVAKLTDAISQSGGDTNAD